MRYEQMSNFRDIVNWQSQNRGNSKSARHNPISHLGLIRETFGKECGFCKKKGHFVKKCLEFSKNKKNILEIQEDESEPDDHDCREDPNEHNSIDLYVSEVRKTQIERQQVWYEYIIVNGLKIKKKLDSGAEINCLPLKIFSKLQDVNIQPTNIMILGFGNNSSKIKPLGIAKLNCIMKEVRKVVKFLVVDVDSEPILGLSDCVDFGLIKRVDNLNHSLKSENDLFNHYSDLFTGTGNFPGTYHIHIKSDAIPVVNPPPTSPSRPVRKTEKTLERLEGSGIISRIDKPTNWVHNLVIREKMNGELRLCLDPKDLNSAVRRELYLIPKPEDIIAQSTVHSGLLKQEGVNTEEVRRKLMKNQHVQEYYYDKKGVKNLPKVKEGDKIVIRKDGIWEPGTVIGEHQSPRSYIVEDDSGKILRRNRKLLKTSSSDFSKPSDESSEGSGRSEGRVSRTIGKPVRFDDYILS
ncbi:hypothetical protein JTB14_034051 [Gonioctena quinquepunctata]|nr:hypothetical protein JTB14_034051 [Gonioctena quinquepunctata]